MYANIPVPLDRGRDIAYATPMTTFTLPSDDDVIRPRREWVKESLCRNLSLEESSRIFFPAQGRPRLYPPYKAFCNNCPVLNECLAYAIAHDFPGVWGGTSYMERKEEITKAQKSAMKKRAIQEGWYEQYDFEFEVRKPEELPPEEESPEEEFPEPLPVVLEVQVEFRIDLLPAFVL